MPKRNLTNHRLDEAIRIATTAHQGGLTDDEVRDLIEAAIAGNPDLEKKGAKATARSEYELLAHARLRPYLLALYRVVKRTIDAQPPGGRLRLNHLMMTKARQALDHPKGVPAALRQLRQDFTK